MPNETCGGARSGRTTGHAGGTVRDLEAVATLTSGARGCCRVQGGGTYDDVTESTCREMAGGAPFSFTANSRC